MWQEIIVGLIILAAFVVAGRWLWQSVRCRQKGGCSLCGDVGCKHRKAEKQ